MAEDSFPQSKVVLMYHTFYTDQAELAALPEVDRPYAVSIEEFDWQLRQISQQTKLACEITFDDGHRSVLSHALPILKKFGLSGVFFISPKLLETADDFCSWKDLATLDRSGVRVESHALTHTLLTDLCLADVEYELFESKRLIEQHLNKQVNALSFPGGRYNADILHAAEQVYEQIFTSDIGVAGDTSPFPRFALRDATSRGEFTNIINADPGYIAKLSRQDRAKKWLKGVLGNAGYVKLYKLVKGLRR